jgi:hypothetical protein
MLIVSADRRLRRQLPEMYDLEAEREVPIGD